MTLWRRKHYCCECQGRATIPWAKRGRRLTWVCRDCYITYGYFKYFFQPLEERP